MRRSRCWDVLVGMIAIAAAGLAVWTVTPGDQERRFRQIRAGMFEGEVRIIMGSRGDPAAKKYRITGVFSIKRGIFQAALALWRTLIVSVLPSFCESRSMSKAIRSWICSWVR